MTIPAWARRAAGALRSAAADDLMTAFFGPVIVLLLCYSLYTTNDRFDYISNDFTTANDRFGEINDISVADISVAHEASNNVRRTAPDDKIDELDTKIDEFDLKLTARLEEFEAKLTARLDEINLKLTALISQVDAKLTEQINGIDLKLTALIAALGKTGEVDAAVSGELIQSG